MNAWNGQSRLWCYSYGRAVTPLSANVPWHGVWDARLPKTPEGKFSFCIWKKGKLTLIPKATFNKTPIDYLFAFANSLLIQISWKWTVSHSIDDMESRRRKFFCALKQSAAVTVALKAFSGWTAVDPAGWSVQTASLCQYQNSRKSCFSVW